MKKSVLLLTLCLIANSCREQTNKVQEKEKEPEVVKNQLAFSFNAIIEKDDTFVLYFLDENQKDITTKNSVSVNVLGSSTPQELIFKIKEEVVPDKLFLKFGNDEMSQKLTILDSEISYGDQTILIKKENFFQFFIPNNNINYNREDFTATGKVVDGKYKPRFDSRAVLNDKILLTF